MECRVYGSGSSVVVGVSVVVASVCLVASVVTATVVSVVVSA